MEVWRWLRSTYHFIEMEVELTANIKKERKVEN